MHGKRAGIVLTGGNVDRETLHRRAQRRVPNREASMTEDHENLTPFAHAANNRCFGCGPANPTGLQLEFLLARRRLGRRFSAHRSSASTATPATCMAASSRLFSMRP